MSRAWVCAGVWIFITAGTIVLRFTIFSGTSSTDRWTMTLAYLLGTWIPLMAASVVEQRRLALAAGMRGHGTFGVLRGWVKTSGVELLLDEQDEKRSRAVRDAIVELRRFRRVLGFAFAASIVVLPLLLV